MHCLDISNLSPALIHQLIEKAHEFKRHANWPAFIHHDVALLFYENSTRTRVSFELAAKRLGMTVIALDLSTSSEAKGEVIEDTFATLMAMGIKTFVIRHSEAGIAERLSLKAKPSVSIINAGDGCHAHPTQVLLDLMTIKSFKPGDKPLKMVIIGDLRHSRVAASWETLATMMPLGEMVWVAPKIWQPAGVKVGRVTDDLKSGLMDADIVMCLRVQRERLLGHEQLDLETYRRDYALTEKALSFAKPDAIVMHPGPMNRGVEIDSVVADGPQSVILDQVNNGVWMRMAILDHYKH